MGSRKRSDESAQQLRLKRMWIGGTIADSLNGGCDDLSDDGVGRCRVMGLNNTFCRLGRFDVV